MCKKYIVGLFIMLLLASPSFAMGDIFYVSLKKRLYRDEKIVSANRWSTKYGDLLCIYSRPRTYVWGSDVEEQNLQHFVCYVQSKGHLNAVYQENVYVLFVGIVQYNDDLLHVTFPGGTTDHTKIYSFDGKNVSVRPDSE